VQHTGCATRITADTDVGAGGVCIRSGGPNGVDGSASGRWYFSADGLPGIRKRLVRASQNLHREKHGGRCGRIEFAVGCADV